MHDSTIRNQLQHDMPALEYFVGKSEVGLVQVPTDLLLRILETLDKLQDNYIIISKEKLTKMLQFSVSQASLCNQEFPMYSVRLNLMNQHIDTEGLVSSGAMTEAMIKERLFDYTFRSLEDDSKE